MKAMSAAANCSGHCFIRIDSIKKTKQFSDPFTIGELLIYLFQSKKSSPFFEKTINSYLLLFLGLYIICSLI